MSQKELIKIFIFNRWYFTDRLALPQEVRFKQLPTILRTKNKNLATDYSKDARGLLFKMEYTRLCTRQFFSMNDYVETVSNSLSLHARH